MVSFLELPPPVRRRIYVHAGLVRYCPISLNTEGGDKTQYLQACDQWIRDHTHAPLSFEERSAMLCYYRARKVANRTVNADADGFDCICPPLPMALLLVNQQIREEAVAMLFSKNKFRIARTARHGLGPLLSLSPHALRSLASLSIKLNYASCIPGHTCQVQDPDDVQKQCYWCHQHCRIGFDTPLSNGTPDADAAIEQWKAVVEKLAQHITPAQLRLAVICDTADVESATAISQTLLLLPRLAACSLRLAQTAESHLHAQSLSERTAREAVGQVLYDGHFPFLKLPAEIQSQILQYTSLVSDQSLLLSHDLGKTEPADSCCMKCTDSLDGCCCLVRHAAYATSSCVCWELPFNIFLVNRQFYKTGIEMFFSMNVFTLDWEIADGTTDGEKYVDPVKDIFSKLPNAALQYIRYLCISIQGLTYAHFEDNHPFRRDWADAVNLIRSELTPKLTLRIEDRTFRGQSYHNLTTGQDDSAEVEAEEWALYQLLAQPLVDLQLPLQSFSIRFGMPPYGKFHQLRQDRQLTLEKRVAGKAYDVQSAGKLGQLLGSEGYKDH